MAKKKRTNRPKVENLLQTVRELVGKGRYLDSRHSFQRRIERQITLDETLYVIKNGRYEPSKDEWKSEHKDWTYAICGKGIDGDDIRVCVAFAEDGRVLFVTAMYVTKRPTR